MISDQLSVDSEQGQRSVISGSDQFPWRHGHIRVVQLEELAAGRKPPAHVFQKPSPVVPYGVISFIHEEDLASS